MPLVLSTLCWVRCCFRLCPYSCACPSPCSLTSIRGPWSVLHDGDETAGDAENAARYSTPCQHHCLRLACPSYSIEWCARSGTTLSSDGVTLSPPCRSGSASGQLACIVSSLDGPHPSAPTVASPTAASAAPAASAPAAPSRASEGRAGHGVAGAVGEGGPAGHGNRGVDLEWSFTGRVGPDSWPR